jgi:hypothetical protein
VIDVVNHVSLADFSVLISIAAGFLRRVMESVVTEVYFAISHGASSPRSADATH